MQDMEEPDLGVVDDTDVSIAEDSTDELVAVSPDATEHHEVVSGMKRRRSWYAQEKIAKVVQTPDRASPAESCKHQDMKRRYSEALSPIDVREIAESP